MSLGTARLFPNRPFDSPSAFVFSTFVFALFYTEPSQLRLSWETMTTSPYECL